jgi:hypothetical protein
MLKTIEENRIGHDARAACPSFCVGDAVVVKSGIADPDFSDMLLDGCVGTIIEVGQETSPIRYLVRWNQRTLESLPLTYHERCESEDLISNQMWLFEDDLDSYRCAIR